MTTRFDDRWRHASYPHDGANGGKWDVEFPPLTLTDMFPASAAAKPTAPLLDFSGRKYSFTQTQEGVLRVARGLQQMGIAPGDRIGLFLPNVPLYVAAYYGAMLAGAVVVNFSPLYSVDGLSHQVEDSGTRLLFTLSASALLPNALKVLEKSRLEYLVVGSIAGALPCGKSALYRMFKRNEVTARPDDARVTAFSKLIANDGKPAFVSVAPDDLAVLQHTGGTTGVPKGAMLTHQNLSANARQVVSIDPHRDDCDRIMGLLPFFHVFANTCVLNRTVANGGEIVMLPRFDAGQALAAITRTQPRSMPGVPTMYQALLDNPDLAKTDFSSLQVCVSGGAPMPADVQERFEEVTGARLVEGYGLTESVGVVTTNPYEGVNKLGTIGPPLARHRSGTDQQRRPIETRRERRARRDGDPRAAGHEGILESPRRRRRNLYRRLAAHGRCRHHRQRRLYRGGRPAQGHDRGRRVQGCSRARSKTCSTSTRRCVRCS